MLKCDNEGRYYPIERGLNDFFKLELNFCIAII